MPTKAAAAPLRGPSAVQGASGAQCRDSWCSQSGCPVQNVVSWVSIAEFYTDIWSGSSARTRHRRLCKWLSCALANRRVAPIPGYFQTTNEGAPGPSHSRPGMPQTSTQNPFAMLPVNPLKSPWRKASPPGRDCPARITGDLSAATCLIGQHPLSGVEEMAYTAADHHRRPRMPTATSSPAMKQPALRPR